MKETDMNSTLVKSLRVAGYHAHKIPDAGGFSENNRFTPSKPYDIFAVSKEGVFHAIEGKLIKMKRKDHFPKFNINKLAEHQIEALKEMLDNRYGFGLVALYCYFPRLVKRVYFIGIDSIINGDVFDHEYFTNHKYYSFKKGIFEIDDDDYLQHDMRM